ncbi:MAG: TlpA family protein disulfide reductase [Actinobacteria bacterium]|nr:TlpA family protein disulfide reductase [Actinomycetota bacterium]
MKRVLKPVPLAAIASTAALVALLAYGVVQNEPNRSIDEAVASGQRPNAPALELPRLDAPGRLSLASLRGRVVVLNFWASWCIPCRQESPLLERWQHRIAAAGGTILGVDVLDLTTDARAFVHRYRLTYPMVRDGPGRRLAAFGVLGYPETLLIDRRGHVAATNRGPVTESYLQRALLPLLREHA